MSRSLLGHLIICISHLPSMVSVYAEEEESVSRAGEDFGEDAGEEVVLKIVKILLEQLHKAANR